jgi:ABC-type nitrate/sulfonate/bicarbonate transport system substrate-binding protein
MKDVDGKKVGVAAVGGTGDMIMLWAAERAGIKVQLVPVGGGAMLPALQANQFAAIPMFPGMSIKLIENGGLSLPVCSTHCSTH